MGAALCSKKLLPVLPASKYLFDVAVSMFISLGGWLQDLQREFHVKSCAYIGEFCVLNIREGRRFAIIFPSLFFLPWQNVCSCERERGMAVERAESGEKGEKKSWGFMGPSIHPHPTHRGHSLRTRGWHTKHTHLSDRAVIFPFTTRRHGTKQKHRVAIKWITLLDPALLICRRPGRGLDTRRDALESCFSQTLWLV
jgi:hypothetical protein